MSAPPMMIRAVLAAKRIIPHIEIVAHEHCYGRTYLADMCCDRLYVAADLSVDQTVVAVIDGLAVMVAARRREWRGQLEHPLDPHDPPPALPCSG